MGRKLDNAKALYMEGIRDGNAAGALEKYTGDRYTQHSTGVADGKQGFLDFFLPFLERNPTRDIRVVRGWEDGQFVFVQAFQSLNDGAAKWVTADFFDTDDQDRMIEHWDVIAAYRDSTPSGHTSVDGPTDVTDLDKTDANKAVVRELLQAALMAGGDRERILDLVHESYIQHNAEVADGREAFYQLAKEPNGPLVYDEIVHVVGSGNFVATLSKARWEGEPYAQADIFRLEHGRVVEHWDVAEKILPEDQWNNSGKF